MAAAKAKKSSSKRIASKTVAKRKYDVVLFGATGFTGGLVADYLARSGELPAGRFALAGRSTAKLEAVRKSMAAISPKYASVDLLTADVERPESLKAIAKATKVAITTVGPYIFYGEPLLKACAEQGTHYVDLTGEPEFVDKMLLAYDNVARKSGARIVNCCGFDSIPHDAGVWFTMAELNRRLGNKAGAAPTQIRGYVSSKGTFSGGTFHSALNAFARAKEYYAWRKEHQSELQPQSSLNRARGLPARIHRPHGLDGWGIPLPTIDPQIVLRTARAFATYGPDFRYGHYALVKKLPTGIAGIAGIGALFGAAQIDPIREQLLKLRQPGQGPDAATRAKSRFQVDFTVQAEGLSLNKLHTRVSGGDPGYEETAKMLAESALCLAYDRDLPTQVGIITPMQAMGDRLLARLQKAGLRFEVLS